MDADEGFSARWAMLIGVFLLIEGVWELFSPVVFGVFTSNTLHGIIHLVLGAAGVTTVRTGGTRMFNRLLGVLLIVVGVFYFVPPANALVVNLLNVNRAVAAFNIAIGALSLAAARSREQLPVGA